MTKTLGRCVLLLIMLSSYTSLADYVGSCFNDTNILTNVLNKCFEYVTLREKTTLPKNLEMIAMNCEVWCLLILNMNKVVEVAKSPECIESLTDGGTCAALAPTGASPSVSSLPPVPPTVIAPPPASSPP